MIAERADGCAAADDRLFEDVVAQEQSREKAKLGVGRDALIRPLEHDAVAELDDAQALCIEHLHESDVWDVPHRRERAANVGELR